MSALGLIVSAMLAMAEPYGEPAAAPEITRGNGEHNWIITEDVTRDGDVLTFSQVQIDGAGWLVLHPFRDGQPVPDETVGHTYLNSGLNLDVAINVETPTESGTHFIVMLHSDVDHDQEFDFVFIPGTPHVEDRAVFEGTQLIALVLVAP